MLYRYLKHEYANKLVNNGEVLFRTLSYYRDLYDDKGVRSDPNEGALVHRPKGGLKIKLKETGQELAMEQSLRFDAHYNDIFVYCMSTEQNDSMSTGFDGTVCVEIFDVPRFLARIRSALTLRRRVRVAQLIAKPVTYHEEHEEVGINWAFPDRVAFRKPMSFKWQNEFRIAFPVNNAFGFQNLDMSMAMAPPESKTPLPHPSMTLKLGNLSKICRIFNNKPDA